MAIYSGAGTLVYFNERGRVTFGAHDSVREGGVGWIEFAGGTPMLLSRVSWDGRWTRFGRHELHSISKRAHMLWDSAVVSR